MKASGATVPAPATHRHCWQQAVPVLKIGLGGFPPLLSLHSVARQSCARSVAEAALSVLERAAASTACKNEKASFILPGKHNFYPAGQPQECLRAVRRQCPQPRHAPVQNGTRKPRAEAGKGPKIRGHRSQLFKGSNGRGKPAYSLQNQPCRRVGTSTSQTLVCQILQLRSCSAKPSTNVRNICLQIVRLFAFSATVWDSYL